MYIHQKIIICLLKCYLSKSSVPEIIIKVEFDLLLAVRRRILGHHANLVAKREAEQHVTVQAFVLVRDVDAD